MSIHELGHVRELKSALQRGPRLRLALLFGSGAKGVLRPDSDLDVGFVPVDERLRNGAA